MGRRDAERISFEPVEPLTSLARELAAQVAAGRRAVVMTAGHHRQFNALADLLGGEKIAFAIIPGVGPEIADPLASQSSIAA
jgi:hypothetical protein